MNIIGTITSNVIPKTTNETEKSALIASEFVERAMASNMITIPFTGMCKDITSKLYFPSHIREFFIHCKQLLLCAFNSSLKISENEIIATIPTNALDMKINPLH